MSRDSMGSMANILNNYATILSTYIENICVTFKFYFIIIEQKYDTSISAIMVSHLTPQ